MIIEDEIVVTDFEKQIIKNHLYSIPFKFSNKSTTEKFPFYAHSLLGRPSTDRQEDFTEKTKIFPVSKYYSFYYMLMNRFCTKHKLSYKNIIRSCINSTYYFPEYSFIDPHIDFIKNHLVFILYMNDVIIDEKYNKTIIFDKRYEIGLPTCFDLSKYDETEFKIKKEIIPKIGKILCFDGKYYHSNRIPYPGENRVVCVFNLLS